MGSKGRFPPPLTGHALVAIDTAPLIYFLEGDRRRAAPVRETLLAASRGALTLVASVITESELLVGPIEAGDPAALESVGALLDGPANIRVMDVTREIGREGAALRAEHGLSLPDALVAATALVEGCTALLGNDRALRRLSDRLAYVHLDDLTG